MRKYILTIVVFVVGLALIGYGIWAWVLAEKRLSFSSNPYSQTEVVAKHTGPEQSPAADIITQVRIDAIDVEQPVLDTVIFDGVWEVSPDGISHLASSANPGEGGNIVLYGHTKKAHFKYLPELEPGDIITLTTWSGQEYSYSVEKTSVVSPDEVSAVSPTDTEKLTVYTCYGLLEEDRFIVEAFPVSI